MVPPGVAELGGGRGGGQAGGGQGAPAAGKVTRTRGPDAAASVARVAEITVGAVEGHLQKKFKNNLCNYSAESGHLAVLQWARAKEHP